MHSALLDDLHKPSENVLAKSKDQRVAEKLRLLKSWGYESPPLTGDTAADLEILNTTLARISAANRVGGEVLVRSTFVSFMCTSTGLKLAMLAGCCGCCTVALGCALTRVLAVLLSCRPRCGSGLFCLPLINLLVWLLCPARTAAATTPGKPSWTRC